MDSYFVFLYINEEFFKIIKSIVKFEKFFWNYYLK